MTKDIETIERTLATMLLDHLDTSSPQAAVTATTDLVGDLGLESIQIMEFVVDIEDHYDISIALEGLSKARTIHDLALIVAGELECA